jgi:hypothetical protein
VNIPSEYRRTPCRVSYKPAVGAAAGGQVPTRARSAQRVRHARRRQRVRERRLLRRCQQPSKHTLYTRKRFDCGIVNRSFIGLHQLQK